VLFNSYVFVFAFLPIALGGFFAASHLGRRVAGCWLIAASLFFYGWWNPSFTPLLITSIVGNYAAARLLHRLLRCPRRQNAVLALAIAANVAALIHYKYLAAIFGFLRIQGITDIAFTDPILPLGISFFTFTQIGYLLDCSNDIVRDRSPLNYTLFVTFFPHLIAGPIVHNREIMPQFADPATYRCSAKNISVGVAIFLIGLLKKCLLADPASVVVAPGFAHPEALTLFAAWHVALSYSLQLYFDFSGYSDMAIGLARMFNVRFPLNFNSPYKARSVIEYWQRWHMTLTRYLNLCLYDPIALRITRRRRAQGLPVNRDAHATVSGFAQMVLLPTFVTMALAGIWHGSGLTFLVFGLLHAAYISVNHLWRVLHPRTGPDTRLSIIGQILLTYLCVLVGAIMFRAPSITAACELLGGMIGLHGVSVAFGTVQMARDVVWLAGLYAIVWGAPNTQQIMRHHAPALGRINPGPLAAMCWQPNLRWAAACGFAATLGLMSIGGTGEFLYFQF
jgi:D-alanyl-lipoteichoic acid acyltransferase DltB (MBOAT superfamily)